MTTVCPQAEAGNHSEITGLLPFLPTGRPSYNSVMAFTVTLRDHTVEQVDGADAYTPERSLTTFFRTANARGAVDCWSVALASCRTAEILMIRRTDPRVPDFIDFTITDEPLVR